MAAKPSRRASAPATHVEAPVQLILSAAKQPDDAVPQLYAQAAGQPTRGTSVLPAVSEAESAAAWGEGSDSNDGQLADNRPPHWQ